MNILHKCDGCGKSVYACVWRTLKRCCPDCYERIFENNKNEKIIDVDSVKIMKGEK